MGGKGRNMTPAKMGARPGVTRNLSSIQVAVGRIQVAVGRIQVAVGRIQVSVGSTECGENEG